MISINSLEILDEDRDFLDITLTDAQQKLDGEHSLVIKLNEFEHDLYWEGINSIVPGGNVSNDFSLKFEKVPICRMSLYVAKNVYYFPKYGVLRTRDSKILKRTYSEASYILGKDPSASIFMIPEKIRTIKKGIIFLPWGGITNYGHYLLDGLSGALVACIKFPMSTLLCPNLNRWQKDSLSALISELNTIEIEEVDDEVIYVERAIYTSAMDHFLHQPTPIIADIGNKLLLYYAEKLTSYDQRKLYIHRKNTAKRNFINENSLIEALRSNGFEIVSPEDMTVPEQVKLFSNAGIVIAASGAALANLLFLQENSLVIEIQPEGAENIWIRNICHHKRLRWRPFFIASNNKSQVIVGGVERKDLGIEFQVDLQQFLKFMSNNKAL